MVPYTRGALGLGLAMAQSVSALDYTELYRSQHHSTPAISWMNDPNGLIYHNEVYHFFYQHNPGNSSRGNISWGHATSADLINWDHQPVVLLGRGYPEEVTDMFFSGTALADVNNMSGLGGAGESPFIAMYTSTVSIQMSCCGVKIAYLTVSLP